MRLLVKIAYAANSIVAKHGVSNK